MLESKPPAILAIKIEDDRRVGSFNQPMAQASGWLDTVVAVSGGSGENIEAN